MQLDLTGPKYKTGAQVIAFHDQLLERLKQLPDVQSANTRSFVPIASDLVREPPLQRGRSST